MVAALSIGRQLSGRYTVVTMKLLSVSDLHAKPEWCEWVTKAASGYDAVLFPGDLLDGMPPNVEKEKRVVLAMLQSICARKIPAMLCTGNHDSGMLNTANQIREDGLIDLLVAERDSLPGLFMDGEALSLNGLRIRSHPFNEPIDADYSDCDILLHHEPPEDTIVSMDEYGESIGSFHLRNHLHYSPGNFPRFIISGHQHYNEKWHCRVGNSLIINSGQSLRRGILHYFEIIVKDKELKIQHHPSGEVTQL